MKSIFKKIVKVIMKGVKQILKIEEIKAEANAQVVCKAIEVTGDLIKSGANGTVDLVKSGASGTVDLIKSGASGTVDLIKSCVTGVCEIINVDNLSKPNNRKILGVMGVSLLVISILIKPEVE